MVLKKGGVPLDLRLLEIDGATGEVATCEFFQTQLDLRSSTPLRGRLLVPPHLRGVVAFSRRLGSFGIPHRQLRIGISGGYFRAKPCLADARVLREGFPAGIGQVDLFLGGRDQYSVCAHEIGA
ncbi:hypothetical protein [Massilia glaciei]|uniref:Uncharacterized protein n=1 Tax=Massilia glaciei TaxID=1524097 RepID=A0A2U2HH39_9BURK|nr:hypothetical protein [Massilia glaciei]PWF44979.1 hypothetical protein C7C56_018375 [Massilia glaciei]